MMAEGRIFMSSQLKFVRCEGLERSPRKHCSGVLSCFEEQLEELQEYLTGYPDCRRLRNQKSYRTVKLSRRHDNVIHNVGRSG